MTSATVTLQVELPTTPTKAFRALTRASQLRRWFVDILDYDRSLLVFGAGCQLSFIADGGLVGQGQVTGYRPPTALEYTWDDETLRFELAAGDTDDDGTVRSTLLTFSDTVDSGDAETDRAVAEASSPGWQTALDRLRDLFDEDTND